MAQDSDQESLSPSARQLLMDKRDSCSSASSKIETSHGSSLNPRFQQLKKWIGVPKNKRTILFWATVSTGYVELALKIVTLVLICELANENVKRAAWIVFTSINILLLSLSLLLLQCRRYYIHKKIRRARTPAKEDKERLLKSNEDEDATVAREISGFWSRLGFLYNMFAATFILITSVVFLANTSSHILTQSSYTTRAALVIGFQASDCALAAVFLIFSVLYECLSFAMVAQALTVVISVIKLLISILCIWANQVSRILSYPENTYLDDRILDLLSDIKSFTYFGIIIGFAAGVGFVTGLSLDATNRLSDLGSTVSMTYIISSGISFCISAVYFGLSCHEIRQFSTDVISLRDVLLANVLVSFVAMVLSIGGIVAMMKVRQRPNTQLLVEEYDLSKLSDDQLEVWARLIDVYNKEESSNPDTAAGREAISLLKAYTVSPMQSMNCRVLRIYDSGAKCYEKIRAWDRLDNNEAFGDDESILLPNKKETLVNEKAEDSKGQGLSKNAAKRAKLKAAKKAAKKATGGDPVNTVHEQMQQSPEEIKRDTEFRNDLIATEALVLLTSIENYDLLSSSSNTWYGKIAGRLIGADSPFKLTCIRLGLLATHWPFRQAMLFTAHTRKPNARAAAICRAVAAYNKGLPRSKRCTMILNPTVAHRGMEQALRPSGWAAVPLPPSHVIDLRPYANHTLQEYLKKIKYRDQSKNFKRAGGEAIETTDFSTENCTTAIDLWWNIASKRLADGNTSVLANPTVNFLKSLGTAQNEKGYRSLLFLKVDGKIIASAVLFRLGDTITSDIQGLDHEYARQYNAYFVMMQETISLALKSGLKFVDFGPTTSQPKMAIGCKEIYLFGGIYARPPLSWGISLFSGNVHVDE